MVTIDSLQEVPIALSNGNIADPPTSYRLATIHFVTDDDRQTTDTLCHKLNRKYNRLIIVKYSTTGMANFLKELNVQICKFINKTNKKIKHCLAHIYFMWRYLPKSAHTNN